MKIRYVKWGIANRFPGKVELHEKLLTPKFILLRNELLAHEIKHSDYGYRWDDFLQDIHLKLRHKWLYRWFILTTPSSWVNFSPFYRSEGKWYSDYGLAAIWLVILMILFLITLRILLWMTNIGLG